MAPGKGDGACIHCLKNWPGGPADSGGRLPPAKTAPGLRPPLDQWLGFSGALSMDGAQLLCPEIRQPFTYHTFLMADKSAGKEDYHARDHHSIPAP